MKHIVCFSGGHSSALVAIMVTERYGKENVILLNHDISSNVEDDDIKRFKREISSHLGIEITYQNMDGFDINDQFDVAIKEKAFTIGHFASCTKKLKTEPFYKYLTDNFKGKEDECIIYYGFDEEEIVRIVRKTYIMGKSGYMTDYPLATWKRTIKSTNEIGIKPPLTYGSFKHANCKGCFKGGSQHWYVVYCERPDIFEKAKYAESVIGNSIIKDKYLKDIECDFYRMKQLGIAPTEHIPPVKFWKEAKDAIASPTLFNYEQFEKTCECGM